MQENLKLKMYIELRAEVYVGMCLCVYLQSHRTALHIACKRHVPSLTDELVRCKSCVPYKVDKVYFTLTLA